MTLPGRPGADDADPALVELAREELEHDRRVEWWLLVKALVALLVVLAFVMVRQRYLT